MPHGDQTVTSSSVPHPDTRLPIGELVDSRPAPMPEHHSMKGRYVTLEPLSAAKHGDSLYAELIGPDTLHYWQYLFYGPFPDRAAFDTFVSEKSASKDPLFFAVVDNSSGRALGWQALERIDSPNRAIDVGHVNYGARLQRTRAATEAQYLFGCYVFDFLGYRRYEWKCDNLNAASKQAAVRLGFTFEGVFRQHFIMKGRNRDTAWFSMLDREWPAQKAAFEAWLSRDNFDQQGNQVKSLTECRESVVATKG